MSNFREKIFWQNFGKWSFLIEIEQRLNKNIEFSEKKLFWPKLNIFRFQFYNFRSNLRHFSKLGKSFNPKVFWRFKNDIICLIFQKSFFFGIEFRLCQCQKRDYLKNPKIQVNNCPITWKYRSFFRRDSKRYQFLG